LLTLYTTPVVYLAMDRLRLRAQGKSSDMSNPETAEATS
jgi:multidrug efflux pump